MTIDLMALQNQIATAGWLILPILSFVLWRLTETRTWLFIMLGSALTLGHKLMAFLPDYAATRLSDAMLNTFLVAELIGIAGTALILLGLLKLLSDSVQARTMLEDQ